MALVASGADPVVLPDERVNFEEGPDPVLTVEDDPPAADPDLTKKQMETTATVIRGAAGVVNAFFGAWNDRSWYDDLENCSNVAGDPGFSIGFGVRTDLLGTWNPGEDVYNIARSQSGIPASGYLPPPTPLMSTECNGWGNNQVDPIAAYIPRNSGIKGVHLACLDGPISEGRIVYATCPGVPGDDPNDWQVLTVHHEGGKLADKPYVSVYDSTEDGRPKYICVTWTGDGIQAKVSVDSGSGPDFSGDFIDVHTPDQGFAQWSASAFAPPNSQDPNDPQLYVVWYERDPHLEPNDPAPPEDWIRFRRGVVKFDGSVAWDGQGVGTVAEINSIQRGVSATELLTFRVVDQPSIVVDHTCPRLGNVYVCYGSEVPLGAADPNTPCGSAECQPDVFVSRYLYDADPNQSTVEWDVNTFPTRVNDDNVILGEPPNEFPMRTVQVMPWITMADNGYVGVGFFDRRDDDDKDETQNDWNFLQRYYFAYSHDGAETFEPNVGVSDPEYPSDTHVGARLGKTFGEYVGFGTGSAEFFGLWWDVRNWNLNPDDKERAGDIYFAAIELPVAPDLDPYYPDCRDCDVDLSDFSVFSSCFGGAGNPPGANCPPGVNADFDRDGDVDLTDFGVFGSCFGGSDNPPPEGCPWESCYPAGGGGESAMGGGGSAASQGDILTYWDLYWMLYDYCDEHEIPFT